MAGRQPSDERGRGVVISTKVHPDAKDEMRSRAARSGESVASWLRGVVLSALGQEGHLVVPPSAGVSVGEVRYDKVPEPETRSEEIAFREGQGPKPKVAGSHRWKQFEDSLIVKKCSVCGERGAGPRLLENDCTGGGE